MYRYNLGSLDYSFNFCQLFGYQPTRNTTKIIRKTVVLLVDFLTVFFIRNNLFLLFLKPHFNKYTFVKIDIV